MNILIASFMLTYTAHLASSRNILPHPIRHRDYRSKPERSSYIRHGYLPKHYHLDYIDVSPYENNPFRRLKYFDFDTEDIPVFLQKQSKKRVSNVDKTKTKKLDKYFDFDTEGIPVFLEKQSKKRVNNVDKTKTKKLDKYFDFDTEDIPVFLEKQSKKRVNNVDKTKTKKLDKYFDFNTEDIPVFLEKQSKKRVNNVDKTKIKKLDKYFDFDTEDIPVFLEKQSKKRVKNVDKTKTKKLDELLEFDTEDIPVFLEKQSKKRVNKVDKTDDIPVFLQKQPKKRGSNVDKTKTKKFDKLFDENGMLFLTQPENVQDRQLNTLLNKVVQYDMDKKNKFLRKPIGKVFRPDEINTLEKIVRALDETEEDSTVRTDFEFGELVQ